MELWMWAALPWVLAGPLAALVFRTPRRLPPADSVATPAPDSVSDPAPDSVSDPALDSAAGSVLAPPDTAVTGGLPSVSVVVPARNEALNVVLCLESLTAQTYPDFEIIVVDDRSEDDTAAVSRSVPTGRAKRIRVLDGKPLPEAWFGKPWACSQGAGTATGDVLLFTDADTVHIPDLLERSVREIVDSEADALSLVGHQIMGSFWEGVVQPQVFFLLASRYPDFRKQYDPYLADPARWRDAIANGQYIMIRRRAYEDLGGHATVRGEVVEDLRLAQELIRRGGRLAIRDAYGGLKTRMYRSFADLVEGWSKNIWTASQQVYEGVFAGPLALTAATLLLLLLWVVPPTAMLLGLVGLLPRDVMMWAFVVSTASVVFWGAVTWRLGGSPLYAIGYPAGAAVTAFILIRSWRKGDTITWKGRVYEGGNEARASSR